MKFILCGLSYISSRKKKIEISTLNEFWQKYNVLYIKIIFDPTLWLLYIKIAIKLMIPKVFRACILRFDE